MKFFSWLRGGSAVADVTPSAPAEMLQGGSAVVLEKGQILAPQAKCPEAQRIADSLREFPDDWAWRHKGYELEHVPTGFCIWVANNDYGLAELTSHGGKHEFNKAEQLTIWPAVEAWLSRGKVGFTGRLPKVKITGKSGTYWCVADGHPWAGVGDSPAHAYRSWAHAVSVEQRKANPKQKLHVWSAPQ
ncbi:hypothetical protein [Pseudomonas sp. LS-2]|uniref:hypothetical protein n=1 Tax=Pseudomonas sp. LS-2 TaxID=2315859 RepID=UPI000E72759A|nr:hypothetical protein [Pseudomonas sp. LS-2]RJX81280.1 hypothetical protein D3M70_09045 [Pseudomonas sp. LS-2]